MAEVDTETAALLREALAHHAARAADARALRARRGTLPGYRVEDLETFVQQGWLATSLPEAAGGLGFGVDAAAIIAEGLAACFTSEPLPGLFLAGRLLTHAEAAPALVTGLVSAGILPALAWQEGPMDTADPLCPAARLEAGERVRGDKRYVAAAAGASHFIVTATGPRGLVLVLLPAESAELHLGHDFRADGSPVGRLSLDGAAGEVIAEGRAAEEALTAALDETALFVAAELMGHVEAMLVLTLDHLKTRRQFGRPIGAFQALQHRAANLFVHRALSRAVLDAALARVSAGCDPIERGKSAARTKARLNDTALMFARESVQLFGAMGITDENNLSLHVKRVLSLAGWLGTSSELRARYMRLAAVRHPNAQIPTEERA